MAYGESFVRLIDDANPNPTHRNWETAKLEVTKKPPFWDMYQGEVSETR